MIASALLISSVRTKATEVVTDGDGSPAIRSCVSVRPTPNKAKEMDTACRFESRHTPRDNSKTRAPWTLHCRPSTPYTTQGHFSGESLSSTKKPPDFKKQLFQMVTNHGQEAAMSSATSQEDNSPLLKQHDFQPPDHVTPTPVSDDDIVELPRDPPRARNPRAPRGPPDLQDVFTAVTTATGTP